MNISHLSDIPGVGEKVRKALINHFGSETVALKVILDSRVDLISSVPEIGSKQAVNIVKGAFELQFGASSNMVLRSTDVRKIYDSILNIIRSYANTSYARDKLYLYFPLPPEKIDVILERQQFFANAAELVRKLDETTRLRLKKHLSHIRSLYRRVPPQKIRGRVIITQDEQVFDELIDMGIDKWCPVYILTEGETGADYAQGFDLVLFISPQGFYDETLDMFDNVEILGKNWGIDDILPERIIGFYSRNYQVIVAACKIANILQELPLNESVSNFIEKIDFEKLSMVESLLKNIDKSGDLAVDVDPELDRYRNAVKIYPTAIAEVESWLNDEITTRIAKSQITLGGQQIITILQSADLDGTDGSVLRSMLPAEIIETFSNTMREAEDKLVQMLGLSVKEADWVTGIFSDEISLPVKLVTVQVNNLEDRLRRLFAERQFKLMKKIAQELDKLKDAVVQAVQTLLEFDLFLAVGLFAVDYDLHTPDISMDYAGIGVIGARNIFLVESMLNGKHSEVQPINYVVGKTPYRPEGTNGENCVILSGANSGGKTTTIQTLAQIATLAQAGFPVPAEKAYLCVFEEIYFFYKSRGMVSAGAFETTLTQFADIVVSKKSKLALFDEIEAITEPGSAANVIAGLLELLQNDPKTITVICSHLAKEVKAAANVPVRIDGIEARGLNEKLELIVDRNPRFNFLARSTPELIVERLSKLTKGPKRDVYLKILESLSKLREQSTVDG